MSDVNMGVIKSGTGVAKPTKNKTDNKPEKKEEVQKPAKEDVVLKKGLNENATAALKNVRQLQADLLKATDSGDEAVIAEASKKLKSEYSTLMKEYSKVAGNPKNKGEVLFPEMKKEMESRQETTLNNLMNLYIDLIKGAGSGNNAVVVEANKKISKEFAKFELIGKFIDQSTIGGIKGSNSKVVESLESFVEDHENLSESLTAQIKLLKRDIDLLKRNGNIAAAVFAGERLNMKESQLAITDDLIDTFESLLVKPDEKQIPPKKK